MNVWVPEPHLGDFLAYDLEAIRSDLEFVSRKHPDAPGLTVLRSAVAARLPWDQAFPNCWRDEWFVRRYTWLRELVAGRLPDPPERAPIGDVLTVITGLVADAERLEVAHDAEAGS